MAKENLQNANVGEVIKVTGELGPFTYTLTHPRTDEQVAERIAQLKGAGAKYPRGFRIECDLRNPKVKKAGDVPTEGEKYLAGKFFDRKEKDANGQLTGNTIKCFSLQSNAKYPILMGVAEGDKIHRVDLETGEISNTGRTVDLGSKTLAAGQQVTATYEIKATKNGKYAALANLIFAEDPVFDPIRSANTAGGNWDRPTTKPQTSTPKEEPATPPAEDSADDDWA